LPKGFLIAIDLCLHIIPNANKDGPVNNSFYSSWNIYTSVSAEELQSVHLITCAEFTNAVVDGLPAKNGVCFGLAQRDS